MCQRSLKCNPSFDFDRAARRADPEGTDESASDAGSVSV